MQLDLFTSVLDSYLHGGLLSNDALYGHLIERGALHDVDLRAKRAIGASGQQHSPAKRRVRWIQQSLKSMNLIERIPEQRGMWRATPKAKGELTPASPKVVMLGFSTELGIAVWGDATEVLSRIDQPVHLFLASPPYPLRAPRRYGNPTAEQYVDFICSVLEPVVKTLAPGGVVSLNVSNTPAPRWPGQIPPPLATPNSPRQDGRIMTTRV